MRKCISKFQELLVSLFVSLTKQSEIISRLRGTTKNQGSKVSCVDGSALVYIILRNLSILLQL